MATWTRHVPDFGARLDSAVAAGLRAAALVVYDEVRRRIEPGYTSGNFVTGHVHDSVTIGEPTTEGDVMLIRVGSDVDYALFWELGHFNIFTRKFERVEIWVPSLLDTAEQQRDAFAAAFVSAFEGTA